MYIKIFESRQSNRSYLVRYDLLSLKEGNYKIENECHKSITVSEESLFNAIDNLFQGELNEKVQANEQERRHEAR